MGCGASGAASPPPSRPRRRQRQQSAALTRRRRLFKGHSAAVHCLRGRPLSDSLQFLSAGADGTVRLWESDSGEELWKAELSDPVLSCATQTAVQGGMVVGGTAAAGLQGGGIVLLAAAHGTEFDRLLPRVDGNVGAAALSCDFSTNGKSLYSAHADGYVRVWDVAAARCVTQMRSREQRDCGDSGCEPLCVREVGDLCVSGGKDGHARMWDPRAPSGVQQVRNMKGHRGPVHHVAVSSSLQGSLSVASCGADGVVREWDAGSGAAAQRLRGPWEGAALSCCYLDTTGIVVGTEASGAWLWRRGGGDDEDTVTVLHPSVAGAAAVLGLWTQVGEDGEAEVLCADAAGVVTLLSFGKGPEYSDDPTPTAPPAEDERSLCVVCLENRRSVIFAPCLHMVCCSVCSDQVSDCPLCREAVTQRRNRLDSGGSVCTYVGGRPSQQPQARGKSADPAAERTLCIVCLEQRREIIFAPCLHLVCCDSCSSLVSDCPMCRTTITQRRPRMDSDATINTFAGGRRSSLPQEDQAARPALSNGPGHGYTLQWALNAQVGRGGGSRERRHRQQRDTPPRSPATPGRSTGSPATPGRGTGSPATPGRGGAYAVASPPRSRNAAPASSPRSARSTPPSGSPVSARSPALTRPAATRPALR